jgi:hypothetical protein
VCDLILVMSEILDIAAFVDFPPRLEDIAPALGSTSMCDGIKFFNRAGTGGVEVTKKGAKSFQDHYEIPGTVYGEPRQAKRVRYVNVKFGGKGKGKASPGVQYNAEGDAVDPDSYTD